MNSEDCGVTTAEEYLYIAALITAISLFHIHCHMALTILEISHSFLPVDKPNILGFSI